MESRRSERQRTVRKYSHRAHKNGRRGESGSLRLPVFYAICPFPLLGYSLLRGSPRSLQVGRIGRSRNRWGHGGKSVTLLDAQIAHVCA